MRKKISAKSYFISLIAVLFITDVAILMDIPVFRQVLGFLYFTIIPGLLMLHILRLKGIGFVRGFLLSVGLSISFLTFAELLINALIGHTKPLSTPSLVVSFSIILSILSVFAYWRNTHGFHLEPTASFQIYNRNQLFSPLLFAFLLPVVSILGTHVMNTTGKNLLLIVTLSLILTYIALIVCFNRKIPRITYPVSIWMISIALLLMWGLTSNYLLGMVTVYWEYESFQVVSNNSHWSMLNYGNIVDLFTACLSTSLLPSVYQSLLGINGIYIYKVVYQIIFSLVPLACYALFDQYFSPLYAFLSSFFVMAQIPFLLTMPQFIRGEIALLFFALAMMVFLNDRIDKLSRKVLFLIFMSSLVVSYYAIPVILLVLLLSLWSLPRAMKGLLKSKSGLSVGLIMLLSALIFLWWSQLTYPMSRGYVLFVRDTIANIYDLFVAELRETAVRATFGAQPGPLPQTITAIVHNITFVFIGVGVVTSIIRRDRRLSADYLVLILASFMLLVAWVVLPFVSTAFGADKLYLISLVLLAPMFVVGGETISKYIFRLRFNLVLLTSILLSQFFCASFLIYLVFNVPVSPVFNTEGHGRDLYYVYDREVIAAKWLYEHNSENFVVNTDMQGIQRFISARPGSLAAGHPKINNRFFIDNRSADNGYIFLRSINIVPGIVYKAGFFYEPVKIAEYSHLFIGKNKIYSNGGAEVYK